MSQRTRLIIYSYCTQAGHCLLGAVHSGIAINSNSLPIIVFNSIFAGINGVLFVNAAHWRTQLRASKQ